MGYEPYNMTPPHTHTSILLPPRVHKIGKNAWEEVCDIFSDLTVDRGRHPLAISRDGYARRPTTELHSCAGGNGVDRLRVLFVQSGTCYGINICYEDTCRQVK